MSDASTRKITNMPKPKSPKMMEGTPARLSMDRRMSESRRPGLPYSLRNMALSNPSVMAMTMAPRTNSNVPTMAGKIPPPEYA